MYANLLWKYTEQRGLASAISCDEVRYAVLDRLLVPGFLSIFVVDSKVALMNQKAPLYA